MQTILYKYYAFEWQKLEDHLRNFAKLAREFAEPFRGGDWAELIGWLHDIGKYSQEFQDMLIKTADNNINTEAKVAHPDHSTTGAQKVNKLFLTGSFHLLKMAEKVFFLCSMCIYSMYACKKVPA